MERGISSETSRRYRKNKLIMSAEQRKRSTKCKRRNFCPFSAFEDIIEFFSMKKLTKQKLKVKQKKRKTLKFERKNIFALSERKFLLTGHNWTVKNELLSGIKRGAFDFSVRHKLT